jgi:predicted transcriptional regulator of viral defense system
MAAQAESLVHTPAGKPDWDRLAEFALAQDGLFSAQQAFSAGYSQQLLQKYLKNRRIERVQRAVYRIRHFPYGEHDGLVAIWLWSERKGVFSHETALMLHGLSDALPPLVHMTFPPEWRQRRLRFPDHVVPYFILVTETATDRTWVGNCPVTSVSRTIEDCIAAPISRDLVRQAIDDAERRGLITWKPRLARLRKASTREEL